MKFLVVLSCLGTVNVEPPVADEVLLVEKSSVGTEEAVLDQTVVSVVCTDVEGLTVAVWVCVVPFDLVLAEEGGLGRSHEDGIVLARHSRYILG